jgi:hypothetical protein
MPHYLVAIYHPDNYDPSTEGEAIIRDIDVLNQEMEAADMDEALTSARKAVIACRVPFEVRAFLAMPA